MKHKTTQWMLAVCAAISLNACSTAHDAGDKQAQNTRFGPAVEFDFPPAEAPDGIIQAVPMSSAPLDESQTLTRIVFASCAHQNEDQSIWDVIARESQDLTLYIGDNVYGDVRSNDPALPELKAAYMRLAQSEPFSRARAAAPMLTVWDDHDYGLNDAGADFEHRDASQALFNYVWAVPEGDPRTQRPGVYNSWIIGSEEGKRVQIIMLDTRYFRSELLRSDEFGARGKERWLPDADPSKTMLGEAQWTWLEAELKKSADLRLVVSSIQVMSEGHGWEAWREFPLEREKLYKIIDAAGADGVIVLSGDRHSGGFYERDDVIEYPLFEATSSSLNLPARGFMNPDEPVYMEPDPNRLTDMIIDPNYGLIEIDWQSGAVAISLRDGEGGIIEERSISLGALQ